MQYDNVGSHTVNNSAQNNRIRMKAFYSIRPYCLNIGLSNFCLFRSLEHFLMGSKHASKIAIDAVPLRGDRNIDRTFCSPYATIYYFSMEFVLLVDNSMLNLTELRALRAFYFCYGMVRLTFSHLYIINHFYIFK